MSDSLKCKQCSHKVAGLRKLLCERCKRERRNARVRKNRARIKAHGPNPPVVSRLPINEAVALYKSGWTLAEIGEQFSMTRQNVWHLIGHLVDAKRPRTMPCRFCKKKFTSKGSNFRCCSDVCRKALRKQTKDKCYRNGRRAAVKEAIIE